VDRNSGVSASVISASAITAMSVYWNAWVKAAWPATDSR
jgi:hypothetical protein